VCLCEETCCVGVHLVKLLAAVVSDCDRGVFEMSEHAPSTSAVNIEVSTKHQVTWAPSDTEKALKAILGFAKTFAGSYNLC